MLAGERRLQILHQLEQRDCVRVNELSRILNVTEETIRRDLEKLHVEGKVIRVHGGAMPASEHRREVPYVVRETVRVEEKVAIGRAALEFIAPGDVIGLDASSTTREFATIIPNISIKLVTNSIKAARIVVDHTRIEIFSTGGYFDTSSMSLIGPIAERAIDSFNLDTFFMSCKGLDLDRGASESNDVQIRIKRRMMERAERTILLADSSKFGHRALHAMATMDQFDLVITDDRIDPVHIKAFRERGYNLHIASTSS